MKEHSVFNSHSSEILHHILIILKLSSVPGCDEAHFISDLLFIKLFLQTKCIRPPPPSQLLYEPQVLGNNCCLAVLPKHPPTLWRGMSLNLLQVYIQITTKLL